MNSLRVCLIWEMDSFQPSERLARVCCLFWCWSGRLCCLGKEKLLLFYCVYPFLSLSIRNMMKVEKNRGISTALPGSRCPYSVIYSPQECISWKWAVNGRWPICFICWVLGLIVFFLADEICASEQTIRWLSAVLLVLKISCMWFRFFKREALAVVLFSFLLSKEISSGPECSILDCSYLVHLIYWFCLFLHYKSSGFCVHSLSLSVSD